MRLIDEIIKGCNKHNTDQIDFSNSWSDDGMSGNLSEEVLFTIDSDSSYVVAKIEGVRKWISFSEAYSQDPTEQSEPVTKIEIEIERAEWGMIELDFNSNQEKELINHIKSILKIE